jgi:hypothetical protein
MCCGKRFWKWTGLALLGALATLMLWGILLTGDPDIQWVGPKCKGIRRILSSMEVRINLGKSDRSMTLEHAISFLYDELEVRDIELPILANSLAFKNEGFNENLSRIQIDFASGPRELSVRQFLRTIRDQLPSKNGAIVARSTGNDGWLEITTHQQAELGRARYESTFGISRFDYLRQSMAEAVGGEGHLPAAGPSVIGP